MKTLLRSTFLATPTDDGKQLLRNWSLLNDSGLSFETLEDQVIWTFIREFVQAHQHVPEAITLKNHFHHRGEDTVLDRLDHLSNLPAIVRGDFEIRLIDLGEQRRMRETTELLKTAGSILGTGLEIKEGREKKFLKGPMDALHFVLDQSHEIVSPIIGSRLSGEVTHDGEDFLTEYEKVESDPLAGVGQHTGLPQMDSGLNGARRYELWVHAGFTGALKSLFALNWVYNQSVFYLQSSLFFSLEMPYLQCRRILFSMHSSHQKFRLIRYFLGLQADPSDSVGLPYEFIRDGKLHEWHQNAKRFLTEYVIPDFEGSVVDLDHHPDTGEPFTDPSTGEISLASISPWGEPWAKSSDYGKIHIEVANPDKTDFTVADIQHKAQLIYTKSPFRLLVVDHAGLMASRKWIPSTTERLNEVVRDMKKLAMSFNRGQGMAVLILFQINREGYKEALKIKKKTGRAQYNLTHLSYANECERSGDVVTSSWIDDDLRKNNRVQFQNLKSRDNQPFELFEARVEFHCRKILPCMDLLTFDPEGNEFDRSSVNKAVGNEIDIMSLMGSDDD